MLAMVRLNPSVWIAERIYPAIEAADAERRFSAWRVWRSTIVDAERRAEVALRLEARLAAGRS